MMTVILKKYDGWIEYITDANKPHEKGKFIAGLAQNIEEAKKKACAYAGNDIIFIEP